MCNLLGHASWGSLPLLFQHVAGGRTLPGSWRYLHVHPISCYIIPLVWCGGAGPLPQLVLDPHFTEFCRCAVLSVWHAFRMNIFIHLYHDLFEPLIISIINYFIKLFDQHTQVCVCVCVCVNRLWSKYAT